ncbi:MAG: DUF262 domain-containing protein [Pyrinomonadaceae bacterium]
MPTNIAKTTYKVSDFLSWMRSDSLVLSPSFQRRPVWPKPAKSLLIDTVVHGIPMPIIFLREQTDLETLEPIREVVDGQQRLRTLISYIEPALLNDFDSDKDVFTVKRAHNKDIAGLTFKKLDTDYRKQILGYEFSVHVLPSETEDSEVLQIFARMNSTGVKLNPQELRNANHYGIFKTLAYQLAYEQLERWRSWNVFNENDIARMNEVEMTSDFIRLMLNGIEGKSQPALDNLYKDYDDEFAQATEVTRRFRQTMDRIDEVIGDQIPSSEFVKRGLFETLFTVFYHLLYDLDSALKRRQADPMPSKLANGLIRASNELRYGELPEELSKVLRGGTGNLESRQLRYEFVMEHI